MVSARKFAELGAPVADEIGELAPVETTTRNLTLDFNDAEAAEAAGTASPVQPDESEVINSNHHSAAAAQTASATSRGK